MLSNLHINPPVLSLTIEHADVNFLCIVSMRIQEKLDEQAPAVESNLS